MPEKRDFLGILIAIIGAVTVVLSANSSDTRLDPKALLAAINQVPFQVYTLVYIVGIFILAYLSEGSAGKRWVYIDVGLCALFGRVSQNYQLCKIFTDSSGGFTVLSTKAVSTLLTLEWLEIFKEWITYPVIAVSQQWSVQLPSLLIFSSRYCSSPAWARSATSTVRSCGSTARYGVRMRAPSFLTLTRVLASVTQLVVPTQFVLFNLSAIVGSAILYGDFKQATFHQLVTFLYGCGATFAGVFIIAWAPSPPSSGPEQLDAEDGADDDADERTIQDGGAPGELPEHARNVKMGSLARRTRLTLVVPEGVASANATPILRSRQSIVSLYGFSPAQVSTPAAAPSAIFSSVFCDSYSYSYRGWTALTTADPSRSFCDSACY